MAHSLSSPFKIGFARWSTTNVISPWRSTAATAAGSSRTNEEIEHEPRLAHPGDSSLDVVVEQPLGIGLVVDLVADADELAAGHREQRVKRGFDVGAVRSIQPTIPSTNPCSDASLRR